MIDGFHHTFRFRFLNKIRTSDQVLAGHMILDSTCMFDVKNIVS